MPAGLVLHEGDALALDRLADDRGRTARAQLALGPLERVNERLDVVAVHATDVPAEGLEFGVDVTQRAHVGDMAIYLQVIKVEQRHEVIEPVVGGKHHGLPVGALLHLAVAQHAIDAALVGRRGLAVIDLQAQSDAGRDREALAKRPRADLEALERVAVGVALQLAAEVAKRRDVLVGDPAQLVEDGVEHGRGVALGQEESVVGVVGLVGRVVGHGSGEPQHAHDIGRGERAAGVARLGGKDLPDNVLAQLVCDERELAQRALRGCLQRSHVTPIPLSWPRARRDEMRTHG